MLKEGMAPRSRILAWRIALTEEPGGLQPIKDTHLRDEAQNRTRAGPRERHFLGVQGESDVAVYGLHLEEHLCQGCLRAGVPVCDIRS